MSTIKSLYSASSSVNLSLASLAAAAARQSDAIDNTSNLYLDLLVMLKTKTGAGTIGADPYLYLFACGSIDGGATWPDAVTGSDAAITTTLNDNSHFLGAISLAAASTAYVGGPFSVLAAFGGIAIPQKVVIVALNKTGVALDSTAGNHVLTVQGVQVQTV